MKSSFNATTPKIVGGALIGFIALTALYFFILAPIADNNKTSDLNSQTSTSSSSSNSNQSSSQESSKPASTTTPDQATSTYNNGTYSATINYVVPKSDNSITVEMNVENGKVSSVKTTHDYSDRESDFYIANFDSLIEEAVTGKSIDNLSVGRIGGASLTSNAFDDAIATIKNEAKS